MLSDIEFIRDKVKELLQINCDGYGYDRNQRLYMILKRLDVMKEIRKVAVCAERRGDSCGGCGQEIDENYACHCTESKTKED